MLEKGALRQEMRRRLSSSEACSGLSCLEENIRQILRDARSQCLFGYMSVGHEPDLAGILREWLDLGRKLFLPRFDAANLRYEMVEVPALSGDCISTGKFGILEPAGDLPSDPRSILAKDSVWLVPGLAFSPSGVRLGRGRGYYDRLLEAAPGLKLGIAWDCQLIDEIPRMPFDVAMDYVVTPTRIVPCAEEERRRG